MTRTKKAILAGVAAALAAGAVGAPGAFSDDDDDREGDDRETPSFSDPRTIDNTYLPITKFARCELRGEMDDGTKERSVRTLLDRTKTFDVEGQTVEAVVIEDRAFENGELVERTLDYFAQADDGTVYYLGENVDNIEDGVVVDHEGTWLYGEHTDVLGVAMPEDPELGDQWRLEDVPGITIESNRLEETGLRAEANEKLYEGVIRVQEFIQPEGDLEFKLYAPGVGVITEYPPDGRTELVGCE